jgi:hypothetical protein
MAHMDALQVPMPVLVPALVYCGSYQPMGWGAHCKRLLGKLQTGWGGRCRILTSSHQSLVQHANKNHGEEYLHFQG